MIQLKSSLLLSVLVLLVLALSSASAQSTSSVEDGMSEAEWDRDDPPVPDSAVPSCGPVEQSDVLIIGCGLAGLFAAARLKHEGVSVSIVEAESFCGGRLKSQEVTFGTDDPATAESYTFEAAANFMYGRKRGSSFRENPISKLFTGYGLETFDYATRGVQSGWVSINIAAYACWWLMLLLLLIFSPAFYYFCLITIPLKQTVYKSDGTTYPSAQVATEEREFYKRYMGCLTPSTQAWAAEYFRGLPTATADVRAVDLLKQCRRPGSWEANSDLKETISHFYVEQENGVQLDELGRGSFGENSFFDFSAIEFFQIDADGSKALITWSTSKSRMRWRFKVFGTVLAKTSRQWRLVATGLVRKSIAPNM
jgi:hypothetical protein